MSSSTTDQFLNSAMRTSVASLCQAIGWNSAQSSTIDVLNDVFKKYFLEIATRAHSYAEHYGRSEPNFDDAVLVFDDMNISVPELEEYVQNFDPVPFPSLLPVFPAEKESNLCFLRPGSEEVLTRPVHVHEYMPPMLFEEEEPKSKKERVDDWQGASTSSSIYDNDGDVIMQNGSSNSSTNGRKSPSPVINGKISSMDSSDKDKLNNINNHNDEFMETESPSTPPPSSSSPPHSPRTPKPTKRLESPGENPAIKRVRMMLEEEGHPLREITSVIMTSSGYLTSSREGKLPDSKPPLNRDFFEPLPVPVIEKKRKIPTMKKIVEGVKKIDKEKENQDKGGSAFNLFEKPDKIFSSINASTASSSDKMNDKDGIVMEKVRVEKRDILKVKKSKSDKSKSLDKAKKLSSSSSKKSKGEKDNEIRDKQKLKIFKRKVAKAKEILKKEKKTNKTPKVPKTPQELSGLDLIDSEDEFDSVPGHQASTSVLDLPLSKRSTDIGSKSSSTMDKKTKKKKEKLVPPIKMKDKKLLKPHKLTGTKLSKFTRLNKSAIMEPNIFENPDKIVPVQIGAQKKKRGRPKKSVPNAFTMSQLGLPPPMKTMKFNRKLIESRDEMDMKPFVPEISIDETARPALHPPDYANIRLQPGLIPAFTPSPATLKLPGQIPPAISITPATPTIPPSPVNPPSFKDVSRGSSSSSSQFTSLPSSVCSSVTITRIDMSNSQKLPTAYDVTPGIGSPNLCVTPTKSSSSVSSSSPAHITPIQSDSGITITPIVLEKQQQQQQQSQSIVKEERTEKTYSSSSGLAKLEQDMRTKEQRKKDKEKRKEQKKEKKEKRKDKTKDKDRKLEKTLTIEKEKSDREKSVKKDKKDKSEKKKKNKDKDTMEGTIPKLTLKLQHSTTTTPADSPNPPQSYHGESSMDHPITKKITIKPIEEVKQKEPSPELARFSPLVTRPNKKVPAPKKSPPVSTPKASKHEVVSFPSTSSTPAAAASVASSKRGRGRPKKGEEPATPVPPPPSKSKSSKPSKSSSSQAGLITETVGSYIDEHGNKIWICPACGRQDDGSPMIGCEKCDDWYHFPCVGIVEAPDDSESWFCKKCMVKEKSFNEHRKKNR